LENKINQFSNVLAFLELLLQELHPEFLTEHFYSFKDIFKAFHHQIKSPRDFNSPSLLTCIPKHNFS